MLVAYKMPARAAPQENAEAKKNAFMGLALQYSHTIGGHGWPVNIVSLCNEWPERPPMLYD